MSAGDYCECCDPDVLWCQNRERNRMALQSAQALEWRADYLEAQAQEARAAATATRRSNGLPATPAPRGTIPTHAPLAWPPAA